MVEGITKAQFTELKIAVLAGTAAATTAATIGQTTQREIERVHEQLTALNGTVRANCTDIALLQQTDTHQSEQIVAVEKSQVEQVTGVEKRQGEKITALEKELGVIRDLVTGVRIEQAKAVLIGAGIAGAPAIINAVRAWVK